MQQHKFSSVEIEKALGWRAFGFAESEKAKTLSSNPVREIIELKGGKKFYILKSIPEISSEEAMLLRSVIEEYRNSPQNETHFDAEQELLSYCEDNFFDADKEQLSYLKKILKAMACESGIISGFLEDESLEEIVVIGLGKAKPIHVFDSVFGWLPANIYFSSAEELRNIINAMASPLGRRITMQSPRLNAVLKDGSRLNACIEPASLSGPAITIRKFRAKPLTPADLQAMGSCSHEQMAFLWMAMQADCSLLVCGNTGSGKTTLLNSLFNFVPQEERIIIIEETPEINVPHSHLIRLGTAEGIGIGMGELIENTLRMRPDRVVAGEVRNGEELCAFIDTLLAGQGKGSSFQFASM